MYWKYPDKHIKGVEDIRINMKWNSLPDFLKGYRICLVYKACSTFKVISNKEDVFKAGAHKIMTMTMSRRLWRSESVPWQLKVASCDNHKWWRKWHLFPKNFCWLKSAEWESWGSWLNEAIKQGLGISLLKTALPSLYLLIFLLPSTIRSQT